MQQCHHDYERFAPQTPRGRLDWTRGIRQFVVGTGGKTHYGFRTIRANSQVRNSQVRNSGTFGVLRLTLRASGYDWRFVPEPGKSFTDTGHGTCHQPRQRQAMSLRR
jgi:acid phosphatase type 7